LHAREAIAAGPRTKSRESLPVGSFRARERPRNTSWITSDRGKIGIDDEHGRAGPRSGPEEDLTVVALAPDERLLQANVATQTIRVVIAHHWALLREGLLDFLTEGDHAQIAAEACDAREALAAAEATHPDVLLLDVALVNGTDNVIANVRQVSPRTKILLLGAEAGDEALQHALRQGARGYLAKSAGMGATLKAIRAVHAGEAWVERAEMGRLLDRLAATADARTAGPGHANNAGEDVLSKRERDVANLAATGLRNKEIALRLGIREKTVKAHLVSIFRKLQLRRRLQLAVQNLDGTAPSLVLLSSIVIRVLSASAGGLRSALGL
jgi:DNA-binding NarL/FixJ family response regulator